MVKGTTYGENMYICSWNRVIKTSFHYYYELYFVNVGHKSHKMLY